jgi:hypothetical protein
MPDRMRIYTHGYSDLRWLLAADRIDHSMIPYASNTGNRKNLAAMQRAGWRLLISPLDMRTKLQSGFRYGLDNGAWSAYKKQHLFDETLFVQALARYGTGADWIAIPDIVAGGMRSLEFSLRWHNRLTGIAPLLLPVQDGMIPTDIQTLVGPQLGIFVGGSTGWKLATMPQWGQLAKVAGCHLHIGRVNTARRIRLCAAAGADSFDGTSASRYSKTLPLLDNATRQYGWMF